MSEPHDRVIRLAGTYNLRDLGGYPLRSGGTTKWRRVLRSEALSDMTPRSIAELLSLGVSRMIDLRGPHETGVEPSPFAYRPEVAYHLVPLYDQLAPIVAGETPFEMGERYIDALSKCGNRIAHVLRLIANGGDGVVLFHCTAGKDRTGVIAALLLSIVGADRDVVVRDYAMTGEATLLIARLRTRALARGGAAEHVDRVLASRAESMEMMLDWLDERYGGIEAYNHSIGLEPETIAALRLRLGAAPAA
jgi:protein-tyrosine phosphatase